VQGGFRADWSDVAGHVTVQGDAYDASVDQSPSARTISGANLLARIVRDAGDGSTLRAQAYYDHTTRDHPATFHERLDIVDLEAQYESRPLPAHRLMIGGGYRFARDRVSNSAGVAFLPPDRDLRWSHAFVQDDIDLARDVALTVGVKAEHNVYTGTEWLPNVRVAARVSRESVVWAALSRAVRAPSRIDRDFFTPGSPPFALAGGPDFRSEVANVAELGWRSQPTGSLSYAITLFHADYDRLRSVRPGAGGAAFANDIEGRNSGVEGWASFRVNDRWRIVAGGTAMRERLRVRAGALDAGGLAALGNDPGGWWTVRSHFDVTARHEIDVAVRHVGPRPNAPVPAYTALDARFAWRVAPTLTLSLLVQNAFDPRHAEWGAPAARAEPERAAFVELVWRP
jgi:iron complex outermembrane receptor protein